MALPRGATGLSAVCKCGIVYVLDDLRKCMRLLYKHEHIIEDIFFFSIFFSGQKYFHIWYHAPTIPPQGIQRRCVHTFKLYDDLS